jgi:uncharacterized protein (TIGR03437 family)
MKLPERWKHRSFHRVAAEKLTAVLCFTAALAWSQGPALYNRNLIGNGDAESGPSASHTMVAPSIPSWKTFNGFTVVAYSPDSISTTDEGPRDRGKNYFAGGPGTARSYAEQTIPLGGVAPGAKYYLSAYMGKNYGNQETGAIALRATFLNDSGQTIVEAVAPGPPFDTDYAMAGGLQPRAVSGFVLPGVTQVRVVLDFGVVTEGDVSGLVADNLSLVLTREPLTGANLMVNGHAEAEADVPVSGWNGPYHELEPREYQPEETAYDISLLSAGPAARGTKYFRLKFGGDAGKEVRYWQSVDLTRSPYLAVIDSGQLRYRLDGWLGMEPGQPDQVKMRLRFVGAGGEIRMVETPRFTGSQFQRLGLTETGVGGPNDAVPTGTRRVVIELVGTKRSAPHEDFQAYTDNISLVLTAPPQITIEGLGNAANYVLGKVSPGEILVVFGTDFGPTSLAGLQLASGLVTTATGETRIYFDGVAAPMIYSITGQLSCIVPYAVAGKTATQVQVEYRNVKGNFVTVPVATAIPGLFTLDQSGRNQIAALNEDYSVNGAGRAAARGSVVMLFATGEGQTSPAGTDGKPAVGVYPKPLSAVTVQIGGRDAEVLYYGAAPDLVAGVMQINVRVPAETAVGNAPIVIKVGSEASQTGATIAVR